LPRKARARAELLAIVVAPALSRRAITKVARVRRAHHLYGWSMTTEEARTSAGPIRCRQITQADTDRVVTLLTKGFPRRTRAYWVNAFRRIAAHATPYGAPKYGYLMEHDGTPVGVILAISTDFATAAGPVTRCNVSSWYVEPAYRGYASLLAAQAFKRSDVVYQNISTERHTRPTIEAQGFIRYASGEFVWCVLPAAVRSSPACSIDEPGLPACRVDAAEQRLIADHAQYGCIAFWCSTPERSHPFVFARRALKGFIPCVQLVYCTDIDGVVRFAPAIARRLATMGRLFVIINANGSIAGLLGRYFADAGPKYFKGPRSPRLGDLAYTEAAMFGM
jgi:hypothetical protein